MLTASPVEPGAGAPAPSAPDDTGPTGAGDDACRMLIADDEPDLRHLLAAVFEGIGWDVIEAEDGARALEHLDSGRFHVILLDERMPRLTGSEVYQRLREAGDNTPVILMTAARNIHELARRLGIPYFLGKPFDLDALFAVVNCVAPEQCREEPAAPTLDVR